ncbi:hypothetical protein ACWGI0_21295 [Streptomyces sp. NPDC054802]
MAHGRHGPRLPSAALPRTGLSRSAPRSARIDARARDGVPDPVRCGRPADRRRTAPGV